MKKIEKSAKIRFLLAITLWIIATILLIQDNGVYNGKWFTPVFIGGLILFRFLKEIKYKI